MSEEDINARRIADFVHDRLRQALEGGVRPDESKADVIEELQEVGKNMGVQVEMADPMTPEQEAAARLDGSFDPTTLNLKVKLPVVRPVEFIKMTFVVGPEKK